jgi:AraC-like DNA-binding protein
MGLLIDTSTVAPHERMELWSAATSALFCPSELRPVHPAPFCGRMARYGLGPLDVFRVRGSAVQLERTTRGIRAADPEFFSLSMLRSGCLLARQEERASEVGQGVVAALDSSLPFAMRADGAFDQIVITIPKALLRPHAERIARRTGCAVSLRSGPGRVAAALVAQVVAELESGRVGPQDADLADGLLALVRALYAGEAAGEQAGGMQDVHLRAVKAYIEAHLQDRDLGPASIARAQFISLRYLHKLFEREGVTVSRFIRERRLERCRRDLQDPALAHETILAIAARWGFASASHFSHAVRAAYGCSPSELREARALPGRRRVSPSGP